MILLSLTSFRECSGFIIRIQEEGNSGQLLHIPPEETGPHQPDPASGTTGQESQNHVTSCQTIGQ